ncbi:MAG: hypothetical protein JEY99_04975 [Spirochaetales bacterium]|nr:hypothetical protein [Spirochaetales bacterium]
MLISTMKPRPFLTLFFLVLLLFSMDAQEVSLEVETFNAPPPSTLSEEQILSGYPRINRDFSGLDEAVRGLPRAATIEETVEQLARLAGDEWERCRAVYIWMTTNIAYDTRAFFSGSRSATSPGGVFSSGKSVCQGYSELFVSLAEGLGLQAMLVSGYSKGYGYRSGQGFSRTNHAWNSVFLDDTWHLFDSTWGAGHVNGRSFVRQYDEFWFDPHPELFLKTHLSEDPSWQLVSAPITLLDYVNSRYIPSYTFEGLNALAVEDQRILDGLSLSGELADFYSFEGYEIELLNVPLGKTLKAGEPVEISIRAPGVSEGAFINNSNFTFFEKEGDIFTGTITPQRGNLRLGLKIHYKNKTSFWGVAEYQVR